MKWIYFCIASSVFIALVFFIGVWIFSLPLGVSLIISWAAYALVMYFGLRNVEAKPLVMNESKWLDVDDEK